MSTKNKNIASQALLDMEAITSAIKEESKKSINILLTEAVKNALRESANEEDDDDYEVQDGDDESSENKTSDSGESSPNESGNPELDGEDSDGNDDMSQPQTTEPQADGIDAGAEEVPAAGQEGGEPEMAQDGGEGNGEEGWDAFSDYQVGDSNTYDLTGENDYDTVVKVYKLLNDEDQVVVKKEGDKLNIQDNNAGTEYIIDLGGDDEPSGEMGSEEMPDGLNESLLDGIDIPEHEGDFVDDVPFEDDDEFMDDQNVIGHEEDDPFIYGDYDDHRREELGDFNDEDELAGIMEGKIRNNKKMRKPMKESKEVLFEVDLGYTDNYQDKDPIAGLSNNEPAKGKKSWHKGVPTGTAKPWAGDTKSKGDPFKETQKVQGSVNEDESINPNVMPPVDGGDSNLEEATTVGGKVQERSKGAKSKKPNNRVPEHGPYGQNNVSTAEKGYIGRVEESKELKAIKNENKELKKAILELRNNLNEAYITNVNLGKITKLFLENATSQEEKADIVNRFTNEAKTIEQSNALYESIDKQLKKKQQINLNESSATANGTKELNEQKIYKSNDLLKTIDLMGRVLNC